MMRSKPTTLLNFNVGLIVACSFEALQRTLYLTRASILCPGKAVLRKMKDMEALIEQQSRLIHQLTGKDAQLPAELTPTEKNATVP